MTLNVLLSFAQFEREVIGERVRDKFAASRRKGIWMGGTVPLGYVNSEKKLVLHPEEAETVRWIYQKYLELGAIGPLLHELNRQGKKSKRRVLTDGRIVGGGHFCKGGLNSLLKNRCYIGEIEFAGEIHPACHEPILERSVFEAVQAQMAQNNIPRRLKLKSTPHLLTGFIFDSVGNRMSPVHTLKKSVRYRYYVSQPVLQCRPSDAGEVNRIAASNIESSVGTVLRERFAPKGTSGQPLDVRELLKVHVKRIVVRADIANIELRSPARSDGNSGLLEVPITITVSLSKHPMSFTKSKHAPVPITDSKGRAQEEILIAIGKARLWIREIVAGGSFAHIARRERKCERHIRLLANLAFMPPDIVRSLVDKNSCVQPVTRLAKNVPLTWTDGSWARTQDAIRLGSFGSKADVGLRTAIEHF